jgi:hypothetical protein
MSSVLEPNAHTDVTLRVQAVNRDRAGRTSVLARTETRIHDPEHQGQDRQTYHWRIVLSNIRKECADFSESKDLGRTRNLPGSRG